MLRIASPLTVCTTSMRARSMCTKHAPSQQFCPPSRDSTRLSLHMAKQAPAKHTPWRGQAARAPTVASSPVLLTTFLHPLKTTPPRTANTLCVPVTCKYTTRSFPTCCVQIAPTWWSVKTGGVACMSKGFPSGSCEARVKSLNSWKCKGGQQRGKCGFINKRACIYHHRGAAARATGATKLNEASSRSHAVFIIIVEKSTSSGGEGGEAAFAEQFAAMTPGRIGDY